MISTIITILTYSFLTIFTLFFLGYGLTLLIIPSKFKSHAFWLSPWFSIFFLILFLVIFSLFGFSVKQISPVLIIFLLILNLIAFFKKKLRYEIQPLREVIIIAFVIISILFNSRPLIMGAKSLTTVTQAITQADFKETQTNLLKFVKSILKEAKNIKDGDTGDYGIIPFTKKKQLLKPGAEKLAKFLGLVPSYIKLSEVEDWDKGFTFYKYKCVLTHFATGKHAGESIRSANSKEKQVLAQG